MHKYDKIIDLTIREKVEKNKPVGFERTVGGIFDFKPNFQRYLNLQSNDTNLVTFGSL